MERERGDLGLKGADEKLLRHSLPRSFIIKEHPERTRSKEFSCGSFPF